ncbi:MAG: hypothetical protein L0Y58_21840 [Verrucomicrobia subdivision 3 bacterium]|nr:hypothetical protein [Limisphaerales bacterium]
MMESETRNPKLEESLKAERDSDAPLLAIAAKLCWWEPPEQVLGHCHRFVAQVMVLGNWEDVQTVRAALGEEALPAVLRSPPPGVFDGASWTYWHHALDIHPIPPLPRRHL